MCFDAQGEFEFVAEPDGNDGLDVEGWAVYVCVMVVGFSGL